MVAQSGRLLQEQPAIVSCLLSMALSVPEIFIVEADVVKSTLLAFFHSVETKTIPFVYTSDHVWVE
jgi:hypothetical protein